MEWKFKFYNVDVRVLTVFLRLLLKLKYEESVGAKRGLQELISMSLSGEGLLVLRSMKSWYQYLKHWIRLSSAKKIWILQQPDYQIRMTESVVCSGFLYVNMKEADVLFKEGNLSPNIILKTLVLLKVQMFGFTSHTWKQTWMVRK